MLIDGSEEIFTATTDRIVEFAERMRELAAVHIDQSNGLAIACKGDRRGDTRMAARSDRDYFLHVGKQRELVLAQQNIIRSEEHTSELQSLMRISYAVFCLKKNTKKKTAAYNNTISDCLRLNSQEYRITVHTQHNN